MNTNPIHGFGQDVLEVQVDHLHTNADRLGWNSSFLQDGQIRWMFMRPKGNVMRRSGWKCHFSLDPLQVMKQQVRAVSVLLTARIPLRIFGVEKDGFVT